MAFTFAPTYQDYLSANPQLSGGSEAGGFSGLSQDQWNALGTSGQWNNLGNGIALQVNDPRYAAIAQQLGVTGNTGGINPANTIQIGYNSGSFNPLDPKYITDPSKVLQGTDVFATTHGNLTPYAQATDTSSNWWHEMGPGLMIIAGLAAGAIGGEALGLAGGDAGGAAGVSGSSALATGGFGTDIAAGSGTFAGAGTGAGAAAAGAGADTGAGGTLGSNGAGGATVGPNGTVVPQGLTYNDVAGLGPQATPLQAGVTNVEDLMSQYGGTLSNLNRVRQAAGLVNSLGGGTRAGGGTVGSTDLSSLLSSLFGGSSGGGLGGLLGLLGGGYQAFGGGGAGTAAGAQNAADKASAMADPWGQSGARNQFINMLTPDKVSSLLSQDPSQVLNNPAYQFALNEGTQAINMGDAAQGTLRSGNRGYELQQYGQGLASQYGQQYFNNNLSTLSALSGLAGVNASNPAAAGQMQMGGFDNASNLRNAGINSLFSGGSGNPLLSLLGGNGGNGGSGLMSLLGSGASSVGNWLSNLFGGSTSTDQTISNFISGGDGGAGLFDDLSGGFPF